ncbi:right-handed parallel beta-helix repeat-containing protein [Halobacterium yunchengense]|uniref:right-handed parallel beta-helix repeat-containing protein n=1 Tax=Halobacterium yunchengense TaxID=3108497 RepID=UPI00300A2E1B
MNARTLTAAAVLALVAAALAGAVAPVGASSGASSGVSSGASVGELSGVSSGELSGASRGPAAAAADPTYVDENVTSDATWTREDGPYFVSDDVTVARGATLTIEAGTTVNVGEDVRITVRGSLLANGTATDPVAITTAQPSPSAGAWDTIEYDGAGDSVLRLRNARVAYGQTAVTATSDAGRVVLDGATVSDHVRSGLLASARAGAPTVAVRDSQFTALGQAGVEYGVDETNPYLEDAGRLTVAGTSFERTGRYGVAVHARQVDHVTMRDVSVAGVESDGVRVQTESPRNRPTATNDHRATDVSLRGVAVRDAGGAGVHFVGGALRDVSVAGGEFRQVGGAGVHFEEATDADDVSVEGNVVTDAAAGVEAGLERAGGGLRHVSLTVAENELRRADGFGVDLDLGYVVVDGVGVRNNTVAESGGGVRVAAQQLAETTVADNVVRGNDGPGVEASTLRLRGLDVVRNRVVDNEGAGVAVSARDELRGLAVADNDVLDNDAYGVDVALAADERRDVGTSAVDANTVVANGDGLRVAGPVPVRVTNNSVGLNTASREGDAAGERASTGVHLVDASPETSLSRNDVYGHITGLRSAANGTVDAKHNYWGAASGPYHATLNPDGTGDAVVTDRGKAVPAPYASEPFGPVFERPTPALTANETTVRPGDAVRFSASESTDDGRVVAYSFAVDDADIEAQESPTLVRSFDDPGTYEVAVTVEDEHGVESLAAASVTVRVEAAATTRPTTTAPSTTTTEAPPTGTDGSGGEDARSPLDSLFTVWGGLGGAFYGLGVALGGYGTYLSLRGRRPPYRGRVAHALAGAGVLAWVAAGVLVDGALLTVAGGAAVAWGGVTGAVLAVAS